MISFVLKCAIGICLVILVGIVLFKLFPFVLVTLAIYGVLKLWHHFRGPRPPMSWR